MFEVKTTMKNLPLQIGSRHQTEIQVEEQSTRKFKSFLQEEDYTPIEGVIHKLHEQDFGYFLPPPPHVNQFLLL